MKHWNALKNNSGFTLTEILVTTVILGIVSAIAVPNLLGMIYQSRITDGVAKIEGAIKEAQRQAIRNSQSCSIEITVNGAGQAVVQSVGANNCLLQSRVLWDGVTVTDDIPNTIDISSKGNISNTGDYDAVSNNWTITVSHNNISTSKCVRVEGMFGDVQTGIIQGGVCNTNL